VNVCVHLANEKAKFAVGTGAFAVSSCKLNSEKRARH